MKHRFAGVVLIALMPVYAQADDVAEFTAELGKVIGAFTATELYVEQCNQRDPAGGAGRRDILAGWSYGNGRSGYERLIGAIRHRMPEFAGQYDTGRDRLAGVIQQDLEKNPQQCDDLMKVFRDVFRDDSQFSVQTTVRRLLRRASDLGIEVPDTPKILPGQKRVEDTRILRLAALSARIEAKMAEIGSKEGARRYRDLRRAREEQALNWLIADGMQVLYGRVTGDSELREWRGDRQSSFKVECDTFVDGTHEARMAQALGKDRVVAGMPRSVLDAHTGGKLTLTKCSLFTPEETRRPFVEEDDTVGLMPRPLEESEAYAGPNNGIALGEVESVLYESSFDNRLDGFGNGYVDREEAVYVLLRDGTAYRHDWSFPFTDLAVQRSKEREPHRWFTWKERGGKVTLTHSRGDDEGRTVELEKPQRLRPMTASRLKASYHYLQVGMGGHRQDRRYTFSKDGMVTYHRSGFVAGNVATSYIMVAPPDEAEVTARYRFEDYALILERNGEVERHFFAVPESTDKALPDTVLVRGEAYWLED
ncbi:hypothetical protein [Azospirillum picis]|uniref:Uncharacterized protein n=1 Tax=Azospirillum picis TaxID=488438 RepID=A0ABU0MQ81_9PROT|nr:hypothetical protein [Azospirillum picis]MBP2302080.1 hypothetical protein [Azospirillum picis]MDQ0535629.1 hypothetical protein [Azospirillum picis]